jgi:hypothetical protein
MIVNTHSDQEQVRVLKLYHLAEVYALRLIIVIQMSQCR